MKKFLLLCFFAILSFAADKAVEIPKMSFASLFMEDSVKKVKVSDSAKIKVEVQKSASTGLYDELEVFAKEYGKAEMLITLKNGKKKRIEVNVVKDLEPIKNSIAKTSKEAKIYYKDDKVVLDGVFESDKDKQTLLSLLAANDINTTKDVVDISKIKKPPVMVRARLYVVELTNRVGHEYQNGLLVSAVSSKQRTLNTNPNPNPPPAIANVFDQSVTLSGSLTTIAGILGPYFNLEATLSFLKTNSLAKILDETTISVLENKEGKFHAGGTIYVTTQSISSSGVANTSLIPINYGILLGLKANTIMDGGFVNMTIHTESSKLDQTNKVNGIPATTTKQIDTNVIAKNNSVIVLGGMINSEDSNAIKKIPLLGDIPVLGALFRSESFVQGQSELAFFIVPEIIDASEKTDIGFMKDSVKEKEEFEKKAIENKISKN
jgi:type II secretory pathway component GspD/PulD (secretin)